MPPYHYRLYGLAVQTTERLPSILESDYRGAPHAIVRFCERPPNSGAFPLELFSRSRLDSAEDPLLRVNGSADGSPRFWFRYADGVEFVVDLPAKTIWAWWPPHFCLEDAAVYLLGPILGFYLRLLGTVSLHASVFEFERKAVALTGPGGAGKSTTIASLAQAGFTILNEDVAPLREAQNGFSIRPGYPLIRLWPRSVEHLFGSRDAMPQLTPSWDKRSWSQAQGGVKFGQEPLPLAAVYLLGPREDSNAPRVELVTPREALMALVANTYVNYLLDAGRRAAEFGVLGRLVASVPVRRLIPHSDITRLPALRECLLRDCRG